MPWGAIGGLLLLLLTACAPDAGCDLIKVAEVPLELQARDRLFAVPVTIDGRKLSMVLDTGGARTLVTEATVRRLNIKQDGRTVSLTVGPSGGSPRSDANVDNMLLGGVPLGVHRLPVSPFSGPTDADGVLGVDVLRDYELDIDEPGRTLTLYRVRRCDRADPPWGGVRIEPVGTLGAWLEMPLEIDGIAGMAAVDTGASVSLITPRMMRRLGLTEQAIANDRLITLHVFGGEDAQARLHRFTTVRIGPLTMHDFPIAVLTREPPTLSGGRRFSEGLVGQDLLHDRRIWFSFSTAHLYFSAPTGH